MEGHTTSEGLKHVEAELHYLVDTGEKPAIYLYPPPAGISQRTGRYTASTVPIHDGRALLPQLSLDKQGFLQLRGGPIFGEIAGHIMVNSLENNLLQAYDPYATPDGGGDIQKAKDYGAEIHRSWRRILAPLWMPDGVRSNEARVVCDPENESFAQVRSVGLVAELESIITRFDWHSQVTIHFAAGDGDAGWNRAERTVTVHSEYLRRFVEQGKVARGQ